MMLMTPCSVWMMRKRKLSGGQVVYETDDATFRPVTEWADPEERLVSMRHGLVSYAEWCEVEAERLRRQAVPAMVVIREDEQCAVLRQVTPTSRGGA
jgi:hypothetical protein